MRESEMRDIQRLRDEGGGERFRELETREGRKVRRVRKRESEEDCYTGRAKCYSVACDFCFCVR